MPPCNHEEADTRIVIHVLHALQSGCKSVVIRTVDTDVVVILVGKFGRLIIERPDADIWIAFGMGKHFTFISVNRVFAFLGETRASCLPVFHALSGCDATSALLERESVLHGRPGSSTMQLLRHLRTLPKTPSSTWMLTQSISKRSREWPSLCMTSLVLVTPCSVL